jgi:hypothetical protein
MSRLMVLLSLVIGFMLVACGGGRDGGGTPPVAAPPHRPASFSTVLYKG